MPIPEALDNDEGPTLTESCSCVNPSHRQPGGCFAGRNVRQAAGIPKANTLHAHPTAAHFADEDRLTKEETLANVALTDSVCIPDHQSLGVPVRAGAKHRGSTDGTPTLDFAAQGDACAAARTIPVGFYQLVRHFDTYGYS